MNEDVLNFITQLKARSYHTPDFSEVKNYENHLVFIDGNLKYDLGKWHEHLGQAEYLGSAVTLLASFVMKRTAQFPVTFKDLTHKGKKQVLGEVWAVTPVQLMGLDHFFHHGDYFNREKNSIKFLEQEAPFKDHKKNRPVLQCWMYLGIPNHWEHTQMVFSAQRKVGKDFAWHWDPRSPIGT